MDQLLTSKRQLIDDIVNMTNNFNNTDEEREKLKIYLKGLYYSAHPLEKLEESKEAFAKLNLSSLINSKQEEFDYDEEEFMDKGYNLDLNKKSNIL